MPENRRNGRTDGPSYRDAWTQLKSLCLTFGRKKPTVFSFGDVPQHFNVQISLWIQSKDAMATKSEDSKRA